jgi:hypothetical protein
MTEPCEISAVILGIGGMKLRVPLGVVVVALCGGQSWAQSEVVVSNTDLAKESQSPVTLVTTLPLRYEAKFNDGAYGATKQTFELDQAVLSFNLTEDWALITRTKLPLISQPPKKLHESWSTGLGNGYTTFFLSPTHGEGWYWGAGPVLYYPASNSAVGVNEWGSGPSVAFVKKDESPWEFGAVVNNIWSFGGPPRRGTRTNELLVNPFVSYHLGDGWALSSSPNITANWESKAGQQWTVPLGGGVSKTSRVGSQSVKLALDAYYNAIRPEPSHEQWLLELTVTFLFPK